LEGRIAGPVFEAWPWVRALAFEAFGDHLAEWKRTTRRAKANFSRCILHHDGSRSICIIESNRAAIATRALSCGCGDVGFQEFERKLPCSADRG
jgi:hypothetical protein